MKYIITAFSAALATFSAHAQVVIYKNTPMAFHTPAGCIYQMKLGNDKWTNGGCNRIEVSTVESGSHNIRFVTEASQAHVTYITSKSTPRKVHGVGFTGPGGQAIVPAKGTCSIDANRMLTCFSVADEEHSEAFNTIHTASLMGSGFPEVETILR